MVIMKAVLMLHNLASSWHRCCPNKSIYFIRILIFVDLFVCILSHSTWHTLGYCCTKCENKIISIKTLLCGISQNGNIFHCRGFLYTFTHSSGIDRISPLLNNSILQGCYSLSETVCFYIYNELNTLFKT